MSEDASATYRGFRNQALYVLYRLLTDVTASERVYRPEGAEDLAVFDSRMRLVEVVQVKDHSAGLTLSALKPKGDAGFFARFNRRRKEHQDCRTMLASYGPLGPELEGAIRNANKDDAKHRAELVKKLCDGNPAISITDASAMLDGLQGNVANPSEANLMAEVIRSLQETVVAGDIKSSVELLLYWVFSASEHRLDLTRQALINQLERIGSYLAALRDVSMEWGVSVGVIKALDLMPDDVERLVAEYRLGVQARWEHIVAGADCARVERIQEIHRQFQHHPVVIVRGASGQGKSTLGWRYMHDYCAEGVRFHIRLVEGREHAVRIANALSGHVRRLNLKAVAYLDVAPADTGWSELVRELVASGLKVLIAIREEDFRRQNIAVGDFDYSEVILDRVTKEEAKAIFSSLRTDLAENVLDFDEAWGRFASEDGGPLLEFTHLVFEGESLTSRIATQIRRIQVEATTNSTGFTQAHLELLALAAVANETGARVSLTELCVFVGVSSLTSPLRVLENEFLLRVQDDDEKTCVSGLHALRSGAVVDALFSDIPELWEDYALKVLPLVVDKDIEFFLLAVFSRRPELGEVLFEHVCNVLPRSWAHAASFAGALLWEGVSRYEYTNRDAILAAMAKYESAWWLVCDSFVGLDGEAAREMLDVTNEILRRDIQPFALTPKLEVFELFKTWALHVSAPPPPRTPREWSAAGDVAYWLGHIGVEGALHEAIKALLPSPLPTELKIEELGRFISGRGRIGDAGFNLWHGEEQRGIVQQFLYETDSAHVADDGHEVKVFYSVPLADSVTAGMPDGKDWHEQTMKRIRLLRMLFPNREVYAAQAIGLEVIVEQIGHDPTFKCIPAKSLPMERSVRLNAIFSSIVAYRHNRPNTWKEYTEAALLFREAASASFHKLHRGWAKMLSESPPKKNTITQLPGVELGRLKQLSKLPMFPRSAVDEWGFHSEDRQDKRSAVETMQQRSLRRFNAWRKAFSDFESGVGMIASKTIELTVLYLAEQKGHVVDEETEKSYHLFLVHLGSAWKALRSMQMEFRERFGCFYESARIEILESHERSNFRHLWAVAFAMRFERQRHLPNNGIVVEADIARRRLSFLRSLQNEVNEALGEHGRATIREKPWVLEAVPHLCIICDYVSADAINVRALGVVQAVWRAAQAGGWRPLEWQPIEVEWPKIALVNLVRGRALQPACATLSTAVIMATSEGFEVKLHHYLALPVRPEEFDAGGFQLWESPLLRAILSLQGNILAFVLTNARFYQLVELVINHELEQANVDRILAGFSREMTIVLTAAQRSYCQVLQVLETIKSERKQGWKEDLLRLCQFLIFDVDENASVTLNLETAGLWAAGCQGANSEFQSLITEILTFALTAEG